MAAGDATGRWLVTFRQGADAQATKLVQATTGIPPADTVVFHGYDTDVLPSPGRPSMVVFDGFGVAVTDASPAAAAALRHAANASSPIESVEEERIRGGHSTGPPGIVRSFFDDAAFAWGLRAMGVDRTEFDGSGVRIAILDTGLDHSHPDFLRHPTGPQRNAAFGPNPAPTDSAFVARDRNGHGTSSAGAAAGPAKPAPTIDPRGHVGDPLLRRRYGVAPGAELYIARVLDDGAAEGPDRVIIAGLRWALAKGCHVILMALGSEDDVKLGAYDRVAGRCLDAGLLVIASAGNSRTDEGSRPGNIHTPAKARNVLSVGALDAQLRLTGWSPRPLDDGPAKIDLVAPGLEVFTSVMPSRMMNENFVNGTSVAAAYVAGVAALHSQATGFRGQKLRDELVRTARSDLPQKGNSRLGAGLVQAP